MVDTLAQPVLTVGYILIQMVPLILKFQFGRTGILEEARPGILIRLDARIVVHNFSMEKKFYY